MRWVTTTGNPGKSQAAASPLGTAGRDEQGYPIRRRRIMANGVSDPVSKEVRLEARKRVIRLATAVARLGPAAIGQRAATTAQGGRTDRAALGARGRHGAGRQQISDKSVDAIGIEMKKRRPRVAGRAVRAVGVMGRRRTPGQGLIDALPRSAVRSSASKCPPTHPPPPRPLGSMGQHAERAIPVLETAQLQKEDAVKTGGSARCRGHKRAVDFVSSNRCSRK